MYEALDKEVMSEDNSITRSNVKQYKLSDIKYNIVLSDNIVLET